MKYHKLFLTFLSFLFWNVNAQEFLITPVEGDYGVDFTIVNYVDWSIVGHQDAYCGSKSYDGHQGTDFVLQSFSQMDTGVHVLAADSGLITFVQDGIFDREKVSDTSKGFGNFIAIEHANGYYTYYAHLKKNSISVKVGDTVSAGQKIAEIGSSGNSSDPHLHFELWFDSLYVVDPFQGDCGNDSTLWLDSLSYDTSFGVWDYGLYHRNIGLNTLREREPNTICCPYQIENTQDTLSFWSHMYGLLQGDTLTIDWLDSSNALQFSYDFILSKDYWYYYFWSYILTDSITEGNWQVILSRNKDTVIQERFEVKNRITTGLKKESKKENGCLSLESVMTKEWNELIKQDAIRIYQLNGQEIGARQFFSTNRLEHAFPKVYILQTHQKELNCTYKVLR